MIPAKAIEAVGPTQMAALRHRGADDLFALTGNDLNDLAVLAARMDFAFTDPNEKRDWQNRINLLLSNAVRLSDAIAAH